MITQKRKKTNNKKHKKNKKQPQVKNGLLHGFFSVIGYIFSMAILMAMFIVLLMPMMAEANEPFTCKVALADYKHLTKTTKEDNPKFIQEQLKISLKSVTQELKKHQECKGGTDGK